jgi:hypothetical protein
MDVGTFEGYRQAQNFPHRWQAMRNTSKMAA